jgi:acylphosphatase
MKRHYIIRVYGQVQGVSFRYYAKQKADDFDLTGFVRNESNGTVCIEVEGGQKNLQKFIAWCHEGPDYAQVEKVEVKESKTLQNFEDFTIEWQ